MKQKKCEELLSGWDTYYNQFSEKNYFISYILQNLVENIKITTIENISYKITLLLLKINLTFQILLKIKKKNIF